MRKLTILVDLDDVLNNLVEAWVRYLNHNHNLTVNLNDITDWDMMRFFPTLTEEQVFEPIKLEQFWWSLSVKPEAVEYLGKLLNDGHTIKIVTATHYKAVVPKVEWLLENFPFLSWHNVIIAQDKSLIKGDVIIDDGVHNLLGRDEKSLKIIMAMPHNADYADHIIADKNVVRLNDWCGIYYTICGYAAEKCEWWNKDKGWEYCLYCKHCVEDDGGIMCMESGEAEYEYDELWGM